MPEGERAAAAEAEQVREQVAQRELASVHPVWAGDMDMAVSATAVRYRPRRRGTRCKQRFRARKPAAGITAHQASARGMRCKRHFRILKPAAPIVERRASRQVDSLSRPEAPAIGRGFWSSEFENSGLGILFNTRQEFPARRDRTL